MLEQEFKPFLKQIIEALLFTSHEPVGLTKIKEVTDRYHELTQRELKELIQEINCDYCDQDRAFQIDEIAQGFLMRTKPEFAAYIESFYKGKKNDKLSPAAMEVLAIIAYKQPISRGEIDGIRGVDSTGSLNQLIERQLVESVGKSESTGRAILYGTTALFLSHFGFKNLSELKNGSSMVNS